MVLLSKMLLHNSIWIFHIISLLLSSMKTNGEVNNWNFCKNNCDSIDLTDVVGLVAGACGRSWNKQISLQKKLYGAIHN